MYSKEVCPSPQLTYYTEVGAEHYSLPWTHTHIHTHTHIYIYIYIYMRKRES